MKKTIDLINFMVGKVVRHNDGKVTVILMDLCKTELGRLELVEDFGIDTTKIENLSLQEYTFYNTKKEICMERCPAVHINGMAGRCQLRKGHKGNHRDGVHRW